MHGFQVFQGDGSIDVKRCQKANFDECVKLLYEKASITLCALLHLMSRLL